jgi:hypothetical protein
MGKFSGLNACADLFVGKFLYFTTTGTYQMMVGVVSKCFLVLSKLTSKLVFNNQFSLE